MHGICLRFPGLSSTFGDGFEPGVKEGSFGGGVGEGDFCAAFFEGVGGDEVVAENLGLGGADHGDDDMVDHAVA